MKKISEPWSSIGSVNIVKPGSGGSSLRRQKETDLCEFEVSLVYKF